MIEKEKLKDFILDILQEKNATNINYIKLDDSIALADYMIFATGRSVKNIGAIAQAISHELKHQYNFPTNIEGLRESDWIVLDAGDVVLHLFNEESREKLGLDKLWKNKLEQ